MCPVNKKLYPENWDSEIRPMILARAGNKCEECGVSNHKIILRGTYNGLEVYQDDNGTIWNANTSEIIGSDYVGEVCANEKRPGLTKFIKVVLTIAHICNNSMCINPKHLRALCQKHHNKMDVNFRKKNALKTRQIKKKQLTLNIDIDTETCQEKEYQMGCQLAQ